MHGFGVSFAYADAGRASQQRSEYDYDTSVRGGQCRRGDAKSPRGRRRM
jgi:hypothetical protein